MPNTDSSASLIPKRDAKGRIWSHIRQSWFVETPEELVRQQYVCALVNGYGFDVAQMSEEIATARGRGSAEADIAIRASKTPEREPVLRIDNELRIGAQRSGSRGLNPHQSRPMAVPFVSFGTGLPKETGGVIENEFKDFWAPRVWMGLGCPTGLSEAGQIGLLRCAQEATAATGCPIDFQQAAQFQSVPQG